METNMHFASLTLTTLVSLALVGTALWFSKDTETYQGLRVDQTHSHQPAHGGDLWVVISPGFR
ncbi:MAG: hypothetical protein U1E12_07475 [Hydrogenophaga sp.]|nr:hypothetical protein [Hydrogenophaga sp.]